MVLKINKTFCKSMALSKLAKCNQITHLITHKDYNLQFLRFIHVN